MSHNIVIYIIYICYARIIFNIKYFHLSYLLPTLNNKYNLWIIINIRYNNDKE